MVKVVCLRRHQVFNRNGQLNMKMAAAEKGLEAEIEAYSQAKLADYAADLDVLYWARR